MPASILATNRLGEAMTPTILILPGYGNSGPGHWQSLWQNAEPSMIRIEGQDWDNAVCEEWVSNLETTVKQLGPDTIIVAHSLGCLQVAHWALNSRTPIKAALLVAVPEPCIVEVSGMATGFEPLLLQSFPFPSIVVASTNDPYGRASYARRCADTWGSQFVEIGAKGHINGDSGMGNWDEGLELLYQLMNLQSAS
jgi:predicted alpha/beta hydrolase family esterase